MPLQLLIILRPEVFHKTRESQCRSVDLNFAAHVSSRRRASSGHDIAPKAQRHSDSQIRSTVRWETRLHLRNSSTQVNEVIAFGVREFEGNQHVNVARCVSVQTATTRP